MQNYFPTLTVDLAAIIDNWRLLKKHFTGGECAAVVKADAYGLGAAPVAQALYFAGCRIFFVATLGEGMDLRTALAEAEIYVFHGPFPGEEEAYLTHRLSPVVNYPAQAERWLRAVEGKPAAPKAAIHADTGMTRLGFTSSELREFLARHSPRITPHFSFLMSHFACAGETEHPKNAEQLARFHEVKALLPQLPASLCNSSGIFLPNSFHFDLARPGCALYGIAPNEEENPMRPVATLTAPVLQIRTLDREETIGYGATCALPKGWRIAVVQMGYADGYLRHLSNKSVAYANGIPCPVVGRVSMDMIALDLSPLPEGMLAGLTHVELLNEQYTVNDMAHDANTIGYEILTRLGGRVRREYLSA